MRNSHIKLYLHVTTLWTLTVIIFRTSFENEIMGRRGREDTAHGYLKQNKLFRHVATLAILPLNILYKTDAFSDTGQNPV